MLKPMFIDATWFWGWFLRRYGFVAIPMPWFCIYILPEYRDNWYVRRHELVHIAQMKRDGVIWWCIKYLWVLRETGYWDHPYEVEARRLSNTNQQGWLNA